MVSVLALLAGLFAAGGLGTYATKVFIVDPIQEYRQVRRDVSRDLEYYGNLIGNPGSGESDRIDEAEETFRSHASDLKATIDDIPLYGIWVRVRLVPPRDDVLEAKKQLVGLSNSLQQGRVERNDEMRNKLKDSLGL
ncbi:hypothetical protein [Halococcoides cellulosivorans]|uniref:Uncharacterized protein n=1 Tax=Halococcoides cellulosivorans TaxID=1679096 RepID=A0A2R4X3R5_9EURY|nr:hypothetical protein [Halococcoides cellulosivorans]AWB28445.1 hypothetical protein HARCEL1_12415 [Halococcoides cellulosivorans]